MIQNIFRPGRKVRVNMNVSKSIEKYGCEKEKNQMRGNVYSIDSSEIYKGLRRVYLRGGPKPNLSFVETDIQPIQENIIPIIESALFDITNIVE